MEFFKFEELLVRNCMRVISRRILIFNDVCDEEYGKVEKRNVNEYKVISICFD